MHETFVLAWDQGSGAACALAERCARFIKTSDPGLQDLTAPPGFRVLAHAADARSVVDAGKRTTIIGEYHGNRRPTEAMKHATSPQIAAALTRQGWGSYIAVIEVDDRLAVLRDPSGAVPLYRASSANLTLVATNLTPRLMDVAGMRRGTEPGAIAEVLARPPEATHLSLLANVTILQPGCVVALPGNTEPVPVWSPSRIANEPRSVAPDLVAAVLDDVVKTMAGDLRVGAELSGGFDSSTVLASLAATGREAHAFNIATAGEGGDETRYATAMAATAGVELATLKADDALPDYAPLSTVRPGPQPFLAGLDSVFAHARQQMVTRHGLDLVMTGQGGDAVFFRLPTNLVAADRFAAQGAKGLWGRPVVEDAIRAQCTVWRVLAGATGLDRSERRRLPPLTPHLLGEAASAQLRKPPMEHPWLLQPGLPPAKRLHLMALIHAQLFHGRKLFGCSAKIRHPLLSQPIVETMVACPTFVLAQGPLDRGLARAAMRGRLAEAVLDRRSKGEASDHYARAVLANREWLLETLLEGQLARGRLIDRPSIEAALRPESIHISSDYRAMLLYASIETWLQHWC